MLSILAHRGLWVQPSEKNTAAALRLALTEGFGVETDLRDAAQEIVIAHDPAGPTAQKLKDFFAEYVNIKSRAPLALNIKADGLRQMLKSLLQQHDIQNYFCFDMSAPETLCYQRDGLRFFTRESEMETAPVMYTAAAGVWLDMFLSDWVTPEVIQKHLQAGKQVALVSPELHRRPHLPFWKTIKDGGCANHPSLLLCTDHPAAARQFFHD